jgi:hypothetical protein
MIGMRVRIVVAVVVIGLVCTFAFGRQPAEGADAGPSGSEMAGIQRSLDRLVDLFEAHLEHQRLDLLLKRIQLKERRLEPAQKRLRDAEARLEGREAEIKRMKQMLEEQQSVLDDEIRQGGDAGDSETRRMIINLERVIRTQEAQVEDGRARVRRLEDELAVQREEVEILDDLLLEMLGE